MVDYSKWDHIEISDDEDDTHPNVDTPSLFRWRHQARVDKDVEKKQTDAKKNAETKLRVNKIEILTDKIKKLELEGSKEEQVKGLKQEVEELTQEQKKFDEKEEELKRYEEAHPNWNVDNMSVDKHNRTIINQEPKKVEKTEKDQASDLSDFFRKYDKECKQFGMFSKYEETHKFLRANMHLMCEHLGSYLVIWAVDLAVEDKHELKERVAHQAIIAQYIMELARTLKRDPRSCVDAFFTRISTAEKQYMDAFTDEYQALLKRIDERKLARIEDAKAKIEEEEREARLGPAGLDPLEVLEQLPAQMKAAFESKNTPELKAAFQALSPEDLDKYYNMVIGSGLWVPAGEEQEQQVEEIEEEVEEVVEKTVSTTEDID